MEKENAFEYYLKNNEKFINQCNENIAKINAAKISNKKYTRKVQKFYPIISKIFKESGYIISCIINYDDFKIGFFFEEENTSNDKDIMDFYIKLKSSSIGYFIQCELNQNVIYI